jgi:hypothetical protein
VSHAALLAERDAVTRSRGTRGACRGPRAGSPARSAVPSVCLWLFFVLATRVHTGFARHYVKTKGVRLGA